MREIAWKQNGARLMCEMQSSYLLAYLIHVAIIYSQCAIPKAVYHR